MFKHRALDLPAGGEAKLRPRQLLTFGAQFRCERLVVLRRLAEARS